MNLLIGAVSGNYTPQDLENWVETSKFEDCKRVLLLYNPSGNGLEEYLKNNDIEVIIPDFGFFGESKETFGFNTGLCDLVTSYDLIHNIRFFHIYQYLLDNEFRKVLITDVKDVYFNRDPFPEIPLHCLITTSEEIIYRDESWNLDHISTNLGMIGYTLLRDKPVYNVGVFGGGYESVKNICSDIYLMSVGKQKVTDQTSFNYLIQTSHKHHTIFTDLNDNLAVHLHVINAGLVPFDLNNINKYSIVHQYDRIPGFKR